MPPTITPAMTSARISTKSGSASENAGSAVIERIERDGDGLPVRDRERIEDDRQRNEDERRDDLADHDRRPRARTSGIRAGRAALTATRD